MKQRFNEWFQGESDPFESLLDISREEDLAGSERRRIRSERIRARRNAPEGRRHIERMRKRFTVFYHLTAVLCCVFLSFVLLYAVAGLPRQGASLPFARLVSSMATSHSAARILPSLLAARRAFE